LEEKEMELVSSSRSILYSCNREASPPLPSLYDSGSCSFPHFLAVLAGLVAPSRTASAAATRDGKRGLVW
jgi:hypothetical protein